jgi:hypothetical protein
MKGCRVLRRDSVIVGANRPRDYQGNYATAGGVQRSFCNGNNKPALSVER